MRNTELPWLFVQTQCEFIASCFKHSARDGFDSDDFAEKLMTTDYGVMVLTDRRMIEYSDDNFMYEGFTRNLTFKKGAHYSLEVLELAGYLYKYWISTRKEDPREIYKIAPIKLIANRYGFYHTQDLDYVINDIIERPWIESVQ